MRSANAAKAECYNRVCVCGEKVGQMSSLTMSKRVKSSQPEKHEKVVTLRPSVRESPVDQRVPHAGGDGGGLRRVAQSEDALDDRQLRAGGVQAAERTPVVDHHPRRDHLAAPVHCAGLNRKSVLPSH